MTIVLGNEFQKYLNIVITCTCSCTLEIMNRCFIGSRSILVSQRRGWGWGRGEWSYTYMYSTCIKCLNITCTLGAFFCCIKLFLYWLTVMHLTIWLCEKLLYGRVVGVVGCGHEQNECNNPFSKSTWKRSNLWLQNAPVEWNDHNPEPQANVNWLIII